MARLTAAKPTLFAVPLGLVGLADVWRSMASGYGSPAGVVDALTLIAAAAWLALLVGTVRRWTGVPGSFLAEVHDPVYSPFLSLPAIVGILLAAGLEPHAPELAKVLFLVFLALTIGFGGWITGEWVLGELDQSRFHPGYFLPTVAGGFIGAEGCGYFGLESLGWLAFGFGAISWLVLASQVTGRLFFVGRLPEGLLPTMAVELAPPCVAGIAYFQLHGPTPDPIAYGLAGYAALMILVELRMLPVYLRLPFGPGFWSFTFSWCAAATLGIRWLEATEPTGASTYAALLAAAASLLVAAIAARSLVAERRA